MALNGIPLNYFVDRANRQEPKGLIRAAAPLVAGGSSVPFGLISAMRNPLRESYSGQIIVDYRPRDNWSFSAQREDAREAELFVISGVNGKLAADGDGAYLTTPSGPDTDWSQLQVDNDDDNGFFALDNSDLQGSRIAVGLAAIKVRTLTPPSSRLISAAFGYGPSFVGDEPLSLTLMEIVDTGGTKQFRGRCRSVFHGGETLFPGLSSGDDLITNTSLDKWIMIQFIKKADNTTLFRALGGQFGSGSTPVEKTRGATAPGPWSSVRFWVPLRAEGRLSFATLAQYIDGQGPDPTTAALTWTLFELFQTCKDYTISGTRIEFTCTNKMTWQVRRNSVWYKQLNDNSWVTLDTVGIVKEYDTGTSTVHFTLGTFDAIQPVLKNTGHLNSETLGVLHGVKAGTP